MADDSKDIPPNPPRWRPNPDPSSIVVPGLDTSAPIHDQIEQIEQLITIKLRDVDENFARIQHVLATRILPAVRRYEANTKPVREAANFWVSFYEKAAQIRIPTADDYSTVNDVPSERGDQTQTESSGQQTEVLLEEGEEEEEENTALRDQTAQEHNTTTETSFLPGQAAFASTPAAARHGLEEPSWSASLDSPLTRLDREVQSFSREQSTFQLDEDDHTVIRSALKGKGKDKEPMQTNLLRNQTGMHSDVSFSAMSPMRGKIKTPIPHNPYLPKTIQPANWSGIVDLRNTPLSTPRRGEKRHLGDVSDDDDDDSFDGLPAGMSPPVLMSPARPPRSTAELQLLRGKTPANDAAARIKDDLVRDLRHQESVKIRRYYGYPLGDNATESSMNTLESIPSLSRYRPDTDTSALDEEDGDESLETVMRRVALDARIPPPVSTTPGLRLRPKTMSVTSSSSGPVPMAFRFDGPQAPLLDDGGFDSDSDSLEEEVNNTAHPSAAFLMAAGSGTSGFDEDDSFQSQDSLLEAADGNVLAAFAHHPGFAAAGGDDSFDDETFDAGVPQEETVFGRPPAQRAQNRLSERGELLMFGGDEAEQHVPDTLQFAHVGSSPTPQYR